MKKFAITLLSLAMAFCCAFGLASCELLEDLIGDEIINSTTVAVTEVTLDKTELTMDIGDEETLIATVKPDNATDQTVTWTVSPEGIVTVDEGKVTAVAEGKATVTATAGKLRAICNVTVNADTQGSKVTEKEWEQIFENTTNFTYESTQYNLIMKVDGDTVSQSASVMDLTILTKEGENYVQYTFSRYTQSWIKLDMTSAAITSYESSKSTLKSFKDSYSTFTYSNGKYICDSFTVEAGSTQITCTNFEITFNDGALVGIEYDYGSYHYTVKDVGTTIIEMPKFD